MDATRITRSVELDAATDDVWRALTERELLAGWLNADVDLDIRPGGEGTVTDADGARRRATVDEVDPVRRLALRWWPEDDSGPGSTVAFDLEATPSGTRLLVTETLLPPHSAPATASAQASLGGRWDVRLLLLGCSLLRAPAVALV